MKRQRLGEILLSMRVIDADQLQAALAHQRSWGTPLGRVILEKRFCSAADLLTALSWQTGLPLIDLDQENVSPSVVRLVSARVARTHRVVPLRVEGRRDEVLVVAVAAPGSLTALDAALGVSRKQRVKAYLASDAAVDRALARLYGAHAPTVTRLAGTAQAGGARELELDERNGRLRLSRPPVLLYGWPEAVGDSLALTLAERGIPAKVVGAMEVLGAESHQVLVAPLTALEALRTAELTFRARLVVAGQPGEDLARAERLGARGFLEAPIDAALLVRAVRRCQQLDELPTAA